MRSLRIPIALILVLALSASLTGAARPPGAVSGVPSVEFPPGIQNILAKFAKRVAGIADDVVVAAPNGRVSVPQELGAAIRAGEGVTTMTPAEREILTKAARLRAFAAGWNATIAAADDLGPLSGLDAVLLVAAARTRPTTAAFDAAAKAAVKNAIKSLVCGQARALIDDATAAEVKNHPAYYFQGIPLRDASAEKLIDSYLRQSGYRTEATKTVLSLSRLASSTVKTALTRFDAVADVVTSPSGPITAANIYYLRACVV